MMCKKNLQKCVNLLTQSFLFFVNANVIVNVALYRYKDKLVRQRGTFKMNNSNKFLGLTLALLISVGGLTACQSPSISGKPNTANTTSINSSKSSSSLELKEALIIEWLL